MANPGHLQRVSADGKEVVVGPDGEAQDLLEYGAHLLLSGGRRPAGPGAAGINRVGGSEGGERGTVDLAATGQREFVE